MVRRGLLFVGNITIYWHSLQVSKQKYIVIAYRVVGTFERRKVRKAVLRTFLFIQFCFVSKRSFMWFPFRPNDSKIGRYDPLEKTPPYQNIQINVNASNSLYFCEFHTNKN